MGQGSECWDLSEVMRQTIQYNTIQYNRIQYNNIYIAFIRLSAKRFTMLKKIIR